MVGATLTRGTIEAIVGKALPPLGGVDGKDPPKRPTYQGPADGGDPKDPRHIFDPRKFINYASVFPENLHANGILSYMFPDKSNKGPDGRPAHYSN